MNPSAGGDADGFALRAATAADEPFLRGLFRAAREAQLSILPWDEAQRAAFCDSQYDVRAAHYRAAFPDARTLIVDVDGTPAGAMIEARTDQAWRLVDLNIAPAFQRRGLGSRLMRRLQRDAGRAGMPIVLYADSAGGARAFYLRLGFRVLGDDGVHCEMMWNILHAPAAH